jgi:hypothetical protein
VLHSITRLKCYGLAPEGAKEIRETRGQTAASLSRIRNCPSPPS